MKDKEIKAQHAYQIAKELKGAFGEEWNNGGGEHITTISGELYIIPPPNWHTAVSL